MYITELSLLVLLQVFIYFFIEKKFLRLILISKLVDKPGKNKIHKKNIPLTGGPLIFVSIIFYMLLNVFNILENKIINEVLLIFIIGIFFAFFVGLIDDILHIKAEKKLFLITLFNILLFQNISFFKTNVLFFENYFFSFELSLFSISLIFSILSFLAYHYSLSILDGIDGLFGCYAISFLIIILLCFNMKIEIKNFIFYIIIFLLFITFLNLKKKLFFGNSGSLMLAAFFPYLILYLNSQRDNSITSISYLSLVLIPILDMIRLFCLRLYSRKSPFEKDLNHFHHIILQKSNLFFTISIYLLLSFLPFILVVYNYLDPVFAIIIQITSFFGLIYYYLKK